MIRAASWCARRRGGREIVSGKVSSNFPSVRMVMDSYKLAAGTGYLYLVRRKAPGHWGGRGLAGLAAGQQRFVATDENAPLWTVEPGSEVTEDQLEALFGRGVHPNAEALTRSLMAQTSRNVAVAATRLGRLFKVDAGENTWRVRLAAAYRDHNLAVGQHKNATIAEPVRTQIQTRIARAIFEEKHGRAPRDERELTRSSRKSTASVAGYDLMFVPVKSVAALHAVAPPPIAKTIEDCHHRAVNDALDMLQDSAAYTRVGTNGAAQIDTEGFIFAAFTHRNTRAGDPDLRTHVVVSNKVRACGLDGVWRWHCLDGRPLYAATVTASEVYNTRVEAHLGQELGLGFAERGDAALGKREVREIVGVAPELNVLWSSRRAEINDQYEVLAQEFVTDHGREPATTESIALRRRANLTTREAPHEPRSQTEQRQQWRAEAVACLGGEDNLTAMLTDCLSNKPAPCSLDVTEAWVDAQAAAVIATVSASRDTWARTNVAAEAQRRIRATGHATVDGLAQRIIEAALRPPHSIAHPASADDDPDEPGVPRRRDGSSVYRHAGTQRYTSTEIQGG